MNDAPVRSLRGFARLSSPTLRKPAPSHTDTEQDKSAGYSVASCRTNLELIAQGPQRW